MSKKDKEILELREEIKRLEFLLKQTRTLQFEFSTDENYVFQYEYAFDKFTRILIPIDFEKHHDHSGIMDEEGIGLNFVTLGHYT